jgi:hypothetical protein
LLYLELFLLRTLATDIFLAGQHFNPEEIALEFIVKEHLTKVRPGEGHFNNSSFIRKC